MSIATITPAQRVEVRDATLSAALAMQRYTQSGTTPRADEVAQADPILNAAAAALSVAGASGLPATSAVVANGGNVNVKNSAGTVTKVGVATVATSAITGVALAATEAIVTNAAATVVVQNSAGAAITSAGVAAVAAGALSNVKLPATIAAVTTATKYNAVSVTGTGNFATFTVANGVITAIVLSAS